MKAKRRWFHYFPIGKLLIVMTCGFVLATAVTWRKALEETRCVACTGKLYQIGSGLRNYNEFHGAYPLAGGNTTASWRILILRAATGDDGLLPGYRSAEPWNSAHNLGVVEHNDNKRLFCCPSDASAARSGVSSYVAVVGEGSAWSELCSGDVRDVGIRTSQKIVVVEVPYPRYYWTEPRDISVGEAVAIFKSQNGFRNSRHKNGLHYLTADGRVHRFTEIDDVDEFVSMLTIADVTPAEVAP